MPRSRPRLWLAALVVVLTTLAMFTVAPSAALAAIENNVPYLNAAGHQETVDDVTVLDNTTPIGTLTTGWYLARGTVDTGSIVVDGDVHLILEDGSSLSAAGSPINSPGISVIPDNSLEIYAQSTGTAMGKLTATGNFFAAGIGGGNGQAAGTITINGGSITATGGNSGAGIGGGNSGAGGDITINGGSVSAGGSAGGAGIGGGNAGPGGAITINGGTVDAHATSGGGAGIGGGSTAAGGDITVNGGTVTATSSAGGAGIGGGDFGGAGGTIVIDGGTVNATGGGGGAGIGGGGPNPVFGGPSGNITIGTATVHAKGGDGAATSSGSGGGAGIGSGGGLVAAGAVGAITIAASSTVSAAGGAGSNGAGAGASIGYGGSSSGDGMEVTPGGTATFHKVTIVQSPGGTISAYPSGATGSILVSEGANQTFLITPNPRFAIASVTVDGTNVGPVDSYTITNITADHTITATFTEAGGLVPITPARLLDTRSGLGGSRGPVGAGQSISLPVLGRGGVPKAGVGAVVLNVTVTQPTATSYVTVWPDGVDRPHTANLNFVAGQTVPNAVIAPVGKDGNVNFFNAVGNVQLVADVSGWFVAGSPPVAGGLVPLTPDRVMDTRRDLGAPGPVGPGQSISLSVLGQGGVPEEGVGAVVLNVTATQPTASSFVTVWPHGVTRPHTANLNFAARQTRPNLVIAPVGQDGKVDFFNAVGSVQLVADVFGWFAAGNPPAPGGLVPLTPARVLDTRPAGIGGITGPVGPGQTIHLSVLGYGGVPTSGVGAVVLNVTATQPTASSFVTVWPDGVGRPFTANLNFSAGQTVPNAVIAPVGADGRVNFFNAVGNVQLVADVFGWFASPATAP